jgi:predicted short-subunit dehydrogenase-like oxidoreductase (DUF2520 family)
MFAKIAIIGAGNMGTWLYKILQNQGNLAVISVSGRKIEELPKDFDLYIFSLKDDVYELVLQQIPFKMSHAVHTSGSLSQNILAPYAEKFGVLYPYQTITQKAESRKEKGEKKLKTFGHLEVPICIESSDLNFEKDLIRWTNSIFTTVHKINEPQRFAMHLAAVFACNFTNAMYGIAHNIFKENNLDWSLILPLLENTLEKVKHNNPHLCQTGPAKRGDITIMEKHCNALENKELKTVYQLISRIIQQPNH